jgi:hypothetical protein
MRNVRKLTLLTVMALMLASCQTMDGLLYTADAFVDDIFASETVNLNEKSYAAADYLEQQLGNYVSKSSSISSQELTLVREPAVSSDLGALVPQQVGERLRQLGYNVKPADWAEQGEYIIGGTYDRTDRHTVVNLEVTKAGTDKIVSSFTYMMPLTPEVKRLSEPKPRIFRVTE